MNVEANGEDTEFEDWSWKTTTPRVPKYRASVSLKSLGVVLLAGGISFGLFWVFWHIGRVLHAAWRVHFG